MIRPVFAVYVKRLDGSEGYLMRRYGKLTKSIPKLFSKRGYAGEAARYEKEQRGSTDIVIREFLLNSSAPDVPYTA